MASQSHLTHGRGMEKDDEKDIRQEHLERGGGILDTVLQKHLEGTGLEDRQTALELAMASDTGPSKTSWRYIRLWMIVFLMCMNQGDGGEHVGVKVLCSNSFSTRF